MGCESGTGARARIETRKASISRTAMSEDRSARRAFKMNTPIIIGLIVAGVAAVILISIRLLHRRENQTPRERSDRLERDAHRLSRRLVSEIKLNNKARMADGRENRDLYDELREDIDRSRAVYDKAHDSLADRDYFHEAVVEILCDGDATVLGPDYPGPRSQTIQ